MGRGRVLGLILVVEDDLAIALLLQEVLVEGGHEVRLATDGQRAMSILLQEKTPDLVLTDLNLPYVRGAELIELIRGDPKLTATPVIVATGAGEDWWPPRESYEVLIHKPYGMGDVLEAVDSLLGGGGTTKVVQPLRDCKGGGATNS